ncbi:MAG: relaxase domain-containing protein [Acidobacteria bacterium]|nr:relaxase domain-containing protein [Acidobacteriota bacterium]
MITHANLNSGQTSNYYRKDDYYKAQDHGQWSGRLAERKGLHGEIAQKDFNALIRERGDREGFDIHLYPGSAKNVSEGVLLEAHRLGVERAREYLSANGEHAGRIGVEEGVKGTTLCVLNRSEIAPDGYRRFDGNEAFLAHAEAVGNIYREAIRERTGVDAGRIDVRERAVPQVAYDFTVSAPKSVSVTMAQGGTVERDMRECHAAAVEATARYLETHVEARHKVNGLITHERTGNMVCGRFTHEVSRNLDPQLHTHLVVMNKTRCADGVERAIDNRSLVENKFHFDLVYKTELAKNLEARGYGVRVDHRKGTFELRGVSREAIEAFSSRRAEICRKVEAWGKDPSAASRDIRDAAWELTRESKRNCDMDLLRQSWKETMKEAGILDVHTPSGSKTDRKSPKEVFRETERGLSGRTVAFTRKEFLDEALKRGMGHGVTLGDAAAHFDKRVGGRTFSRLGELGGKEYFCTRESRETEREVFRNVEHGKGRVAGIDPSAVEAGLRRGMRTPEGDTLHLSDEQKAAVRHMATTTDRFSAVQGLAGTGKTTMLNQAREIFEAQGYAVRGVCFTGKAAEGLEKEAGIASKTIHAHLNALEREAGRTRNRAPTLDQRNEGGWDLSGLKPSGKEVWVVDEASMVDNRLMRQVQEAAILRDAKVVFTGDAKQLQPIGAGNAFSNLVERNKIDYAEMKNIQRQKDPGLREAVRETVQGDVSKALERLRGNIVQVESRPDRINRIAQDYAALARSERRETVIVTGTNADRREINERVRVNLKARGELEGGREYRTSQGAREFAPGDRVIFLKNDRELGVKNGQVATVRVVGEARMTIQAGRRLLTVDLGRYDQVDHGYALTVHKAQGITADRAMVHLDTRQGGVNSRNAFYVDISRARHEVTVYTDDSARVAEKVAHWQVKLSGLDFGEQGRGKEQTGVSLDEGSPTRRGPERTVGMADLLRAPGEEPSRLEGEKGFLCQPKEAEAERSILKAQDHAVTHELDR